MWVLAIFAFVLSSCQLQLEMFDVKSALFVFGKSSTSTLTYVIQLFNIILFRTDHSNLTLINIVMNHPTLVKTLFQIV